MSDQLTQRQINFARNIFEGMTQYDAYAAAGYGVRLCARHTIECNASRLANKDRVLAYIEGLNQAIDTKKIMSKQRRQEVLSKIGEAQLIDFVIDGVPELSPDTPNNAAAAEFYTRNSLNKQGVPVITKAIKLHSPMVAIDLLNKMDKLYDDRAPAGPTIVNSFTFVLPGGQKVSPKELIEAKKLTERLIEGERT